MLPAFRFSTRIVRFAILSTLFALLPSLAQADLIGITGGQDSFFDPITSVLYRLDLTTGVATEIGSTGVENIGAIAFQPGTGKLFGHQNVPFGIGSLYELNATTGQGSLIGATGASIPDISFGPDGKLFGWMELGSETVYPMDTDDLVTIALNSGVITRVGESGIGTNQTGLAFNQSGSLFVKAGVGNPATTGQNLYSVNPTTGAATMITSLNSNTHNELEFDSANHAFTLSRGSIKAADGVTDIFGTMIQTIEMSGTTAGKVTDVQFFEGINLTSIAFTPASVPEPSSLVFVLIAGGIGLASRRRKTRSRRSKSNR